MFSKTLYLWLYIYSCPDNQGLVTFDLVVGATVSDEGDCMEGHV